MIVNTIEVGKGSFHGALAPRIEIKHEKPEHKLIMFLRAKGQSQVEVSELTGYSLASISLLESQPWYQTQLAEEIHSAGREILESTLETYALPALQKLNKLAHGAKSETVQAGACVNILDRFLGKPLQKTENKNENKTTTDMVEDDREMLAKLRAEQERLEVLRRSLQNQSQSVGLNN